jgi:hypothetical protein
MNHFFTPFYSQFLQMFHLGYITAGTLLPLPVPVLAAFYFTKAGANLIFIGRFLPRTRTRSSHPLYTTKLTRYSQGCIKLLVSVENKTSFRLLKINSQIRRKQFKIKMCLNLNKVQNTERGRGHPRSCFASRFNYPATFFELVTI